MTTYLIETTKIHTNPGNSSDSFIGKSILSIQLWADDELIMSFGGCLIQDDDAVRAQAAQEANEWDGTTSDEVRSYDQFIREMDRKSWNQ